MQTMTFEFLRGGLFSRFFPSYACACDISWGRDWRKLITTRGNTKKIYEKNKISENSLIILYDKIKYSIDIISNSKY